MQRVHVSLHVKLTRSIEGTVINVGSELDMQRNMDLFASAYKNSGLTISTTKTEMMYQPTSNTPYSEPSTMIHMVHGQKLAVADIFVYLGSTLSSAATINEEIKLCITHASATFSRLQENVWAQRSLSVQTQLKVYQAVLLPLLLYTAETWIV